MLSKLRHVNLRKILGLPDPNYPRPPLEPGEQMLREGTCIFSRSFFGGRVGRMMLTDRRFRWYETKDVPRPFKRTTGEVNLSDTASVDKGTAFDVIGGGTRLRLRLRNGRDKCLWESDGRLDEWIATVRSLIATHSAPNWRSLAPWAVFRMLCWVIAGAVGFLILYRDVQGVLFGFVFGAVIGAAAYLPRSHPASLLALVIGATITLYFLAPAFS
jgi:hypothetical protein